MGINVGILNKNMLNLNETFYVLLFFFMFLFLKNIYGRALLSLKHGKNMVAIHKKGGQQTIKNYCPVSLLPICGIIFEVLLYGIMFNFFLRIICFLQMKLDSDQEFLASINLFQLIMKS